MIKGVLFDFVQTLGSAADGFRLAEKEAQLKIYSQLGSTVWEDFLSDYRSVRKKFHQDCRFSRKEMWEALYKQYGEPPDYKLLEEWEDIYWAQVEADMKLFPETEGVLEQLSSKYQLAVISNAPSLGSARKLYAGELSKIERFFKKIFIAGQAGVPPKPAPEPFQQCLTSLGLAPSEAVYVGDDWDMDICGARDAGIQPIWIKHRSVDRSWPPDEKTVPTITTLEPLLELETILSASDIQLQNSG